MAENINRPHNPGPSGPGHEATDVNVWGVGKFAIGLVVVVLFSIALLLGVFQYFNTRDNRQAKSVDPVKIFPQPQLLPDEPKNLAGYKAAEEKGLDPAAPDHSDPV